MRLSLFAIIFQLFEICVLTILELNWNQRLEHKQTKLNICHHILTSSTQLQNRSLHVVERTRTSSKCQKMKNARAKRAKILFFIVKYANLWGFCCRRRRGCLSSLLSSSSTPSLRSSSYLLDESEQMFLSQLLELCTCPGLQRCEFPRSSCFVERTCKAEWPLRIY